MEPEKNSEYRSIKYWEKRYEKESRSSYEWFLDYTQVKPIILPFLRRETQILDIGCGNSLFALQLTQDGFPNVLSVDLAYSAIEKAQKEYPSLRWLQQDVRKMDLIPNCSIDLAFDKGTLDALFSEDSSPWNPSEEVLYDIRCALCEIDRILRPDGTFVCISLGQPHFRRKYFESFTKWHIEIKELGFYFAYICRQM